MLRLIETAFYLFLFPVVICAAFLDDLFGRRHWLDGIDYALRQLNIMRQPVVGYREFGSSVCETRVDMGTGECETKVSNSWTDSIASTQE